MSNPNPSIQEQIDQLLKPRYKIVQDYPGNPHQIGHVLNYERDTDWDKKQIETCNKYPHLFKKLEWWEERKLQEMPNYVKHGDDFYKIYDWDNFSVPYVFINDVRREQFVWGNEHEYSPLYGEFLPATEQEYLNYINTQSK